MLFFRVDFLFLAPDKALDILLVHNCSESADDKRAQGRDYYIPKTGLCKQMIKDKGYQERIGRIHNRTGYASERDDFADKENNQEGAENHQKYAPVGAEHKRRSRDDTLSALEVKI